MKDISFKLLYERKVISMESAQPARGVLLVVSGASGSGKSTVVKNMRDMGEEFYFSVSYTTRPRRESEVDGKHYYFVDRPAFEKIVREGAFLEYSEYCGHNYGTPAAPVREMLGKGMTVLLEIDVPGAMQIRHNMPDAVLTFVTPSDFGITEARLRKRATENSTDINSRISAARYELSRIKEYDYIIINDDARLAALELRAVISAEKCRAGRRLGMLKG